MKRFVFAFLIATCSALSLLHAQGWTPDYMIISIDVYLQFLNDQATKSDPHGLYSEGVQNLILREPSTDMAGPVVSYKYELAPGVDGNGPIEISDLSACRYCNWIQSLYYSNSKSQLDEVTETGAYDITDENGEETATFNKETAKLQVCGDATSGFRLANYSIDSEQRNPASDKKDNQVKDIPYIDKTDQTTGSSTDSKPSYWAGLSTPVKATLVIAAVVAVVALGYLALGYFGGGAAAADSGGTVIADGVSEGVIESGSKEVLKEAAEVVVKGSGESLVDISSI
jgi:hypothetical protein